MIYNFQWAWKKVNPIWLTLTFFTLTTFFTITTGSSLEKSSQREKKLMLIKWDLLFFTVTENYKSSETILIFLDKNSFWKSIRIFFSFRIDNWKMNLLKGNEFMNVNRKQTKGLLFVRKYNVSWCMNYVLGRFAYYYVAFIVHWILIYPSILKIYLLIFSH